MSPPPARARGAGPQTNGPGIGGPGGDPVAPESGTVYWVDTTILAPGDPEPRRPVVVLDAPTPAAATGMGTVTVVARSGSDGFGVEHPADGGLGLSGPGHFSRRHAVPRLAWTSGNVTPIGPLDGTVFAGVVARFTR
jgi:hypothetical protein